MIFLECNIVVRRPHSRGRRSSRSLNSLRPSLPVFKSATAFLTQTRLRQITPISIRVVDSDFLPSFYASAHEDDSLGSHPHETLELRIGSAGVIDKASIVAFTALVDLVALLGFSLHDVYAFETFRDETCEFTNCDAAFERLYDGSQQTRTWNRQRPRSVRILQNLHNMP